MQRKTFEIALSAHASSAIDGSEYEAIIEALEPCAYMIGKPYDWRDFLSAAADKYDDSASILLDHIAYSLGVRWWDAEWSLEQKKRLPELLAARAVYGTQRYLDVLMSVAGWTAYEVHVKDLWLGDVSTKAERERLLEMLTASFPLGVWDSVIEYPATLYWSMDTGGAGYIPSAINAIQARTASASPSYMQQTKKGSLAVRYTDTISGDRAAASYLMQKKAALSAHSTQIVMGQNITKDI